MDIHRNLGPSLFESVYEVVLMQVLIRRGLHVVRQQAISFEYDGIVFDEGFRIDLLVDHCVLVELKSVERLAPVRARRSRAITRLAALRGAASAVC